MSNREQIEAKIQQGEFQEAMTMAVLEAMKLEIVTSSQGKEDNAYVTKINLLDNEIENKLGDPSLEKFHFSQVEKAQIMMLDNVANLQKMFALLQENIDSL